MVDNLKKENHRNQLGSISPSDHFVVRDEERDKKAVEVLSGDPTSRWYPPLDRRSFSQALGEYAGLDMAITMYDHGNNPHELGYNR